MSRKDLNFLDGVSIEEPDDEKCRLSVLELLLPASEEGVGDTESVGVAACIYTLSAPTGTRT